jgi:hypothetical protein
MQKYNYGLEKMKFKILFLLLFVFILPSVSASETNYLVVKKNGKNIEYNSIIYITKFPIFPNLTAEIPVDCNKVKWTLKASFNRPNRNKKETPFIIKRNGNKIWKFDEAISPKFIGGILIISAKTEKGINYIFSLNIRGKNPSTNEILNYIGTHPKFAQAIARHESGMQNGRYYCQFNEVGTLGENYLHDIKHTPNRGSDMLGWGIFQITNPSPTKTDLWNWKINIDTGKRILIEKEKMAEDYFKAIKRTYPEKYETPPKELKIPGTNTRLTSLEAATIQLYNGGAIVKSLKNSLGSYSTYASCWKFLPDNPSGKRWEFIHNRNNYVKKVLLAYEAIQKKNSEK